VTQAIWLSASCVRNAGWEYRDGSMGIDEFAATGVDEIRTALNPKCVLVEHMESVWRCNIRIWTVLLTET
jgi:hypothetical protein